jgi:hypothetical protein
MKGFRTAVAVAVLAFGWLAGCNDYNNSIQYNTGATLLNISPNGLSAGGSDFLLTVNASQFNGFNSTTVIQWNNKKLATTFVDITTLTATVPASLLAKPGVAYVNTLTSQSGNGQNGLSNTLAFNIYGAPNPVPTITSVSPDNAPACGTSCGSASVNITVTGTNFLPTSNNGGSLVTFKDNLTVQQQPTALTISSITDTEIKATIPGTYLANDDVGLIQVLNPQNGLCTNPACLPLAGGGASNILIFTIGAGLAPATAEETPAISQDGRYVAYASQQNQVNQILLKDTCVGVTSGCTASTRVISAAADGTAGNADSHNAVITPDGRYVAFSSAATNLAEGAPTGRQIFLRDTCIGADNSCKPSTTLISTDASGALNGTESILPSISTSGRYVAFVAVTASANASRVAGPAANVAAAPNSGLRQVFVRDTCLGASDCTPKTTRISLAPGDAPGAGAKPAGPAISGQAKQIALTDGKSATMLTPTVKVDDNVFVAVPKEQ